MWRLQWRSSVYKILVMRVLCLKHENINIGVIEVDLEKPENWHCRYNYLLKINTTEKREIIVS